jgi:hypothetical protein
MEKLRVVKMTPAGAFYSDFNGAAVEEQQSFFAAGTAVLGCCRRQGLSLIHT